MNYRNANASHCAFRITAIVHSFKIRSWLFLQLTNLFGRPLFTSCLVMDTNTPNSRSTLQHRSIHSLPCNSPRQHRREPRHYHRMISLALLRECDVLQKAGRINGSSLRCVRYLAVVIRDASRPKMMRRIMLFSFFVEGLFIILLATFCCNHVNSTLYLCICLVVQKLLLCNVVVIELSVQLSLTIVP